jgi:hypothetical protein
MNTSSKLNETSAGPASAAISLPPLIAGWAISNASESPVKFGLVTLLAAFVGFLSYQVYRPSVHKLSPAFTKDTIPIIGSFGFVSRQW